MADQGWNPWKLTTIGLGLAAIVAVVTGVVVANWTGRDADSKAETPTVTTRSASTQKSTPAVNVVRGVETAAAARPSAPAAVAQSPAIPSQSAIDACNQQAAAQTSQRSKTKEIVIDGAIGAVAGAVVGAAGGAIVDGGSGAGKGAAIGGVLGAGGGALYGLNENRKNDAHYRDVYTACMRSRGYSS